MKNESEEVAAQRNYYAETAREYEAMHVVEKDEHFFALSFLVAALDYLEAKSVLDVGSGTGRAVRHLQKQCPGLRVVGVEPAKELREVGYAQGLSKECLIDGNATELNYNASEFDIVCAFGVLHHIRNPERAVSEMIRVANKAVFISDVNNFGQGSAAGRTIKQMLNFLGCWKLVDLIKTKGKGYTISEGDGLAYSYSVFNNYKQIKAHCRSIHLLNTKDCDISLYRTSSHVALLGIKK